MSNSLIYTENKNDFTAKGDVLVHGEAVHVRVHDLRDVTTAVYVNGYAYGYRESQYFVLLRG